MTPEFMHYGRDQTPPKSLGRREENALVEYLQAEAREEWSKRMEALVNVRQKAKENAGKAQECQKFYFNQDVQ